MPVPKRKVSKARKGSRASSNMRIKVKTVMTCPTCQAAVLPHQLCKECGHYKGVKVIKTKSDRMYKRAQERQSRQEKKQVDKPEEQNTEQK